MVESMLRAALALSVLLMARAARPGDDQAVPVMVGLGAAAGLSAIAGLMQFVGGWPAAGNPQGPESGLAGAYGWLHRLSVVVAPVPSPGLAYANLRQPNQFATLMVIGWVATASLLWTNAGRRRRGIVAWALPLAVLLGVGNAASGSRTGLLLWLLTGLLLWRLSRSQAAGGAVRQVVVAGAVAYGLALLALPVVVASDRHLLSRWLGDAPDCASRRVLWAHVLHLISLKPWQGWGWGELDYAHYLTPYPGLHFCDLLDNAHNLPLHLAVELGVPAALLLCGLALRFVWRRQPWRERDPLRCAAWLVLGAIGVHSLLEYPLWYGPFQLTALLCVMLVWRPVGADRVSPPHAALPRHGGGESRWRVLALALLLCAVSLYATWDYHRVSQLFLPPERRSAWYRDDPWASARSSWLFAEQVRFAELMTTPITPDNADRMAAQAEHLLHFSPESAVVDILIRSLRLAGRDAEAAWHAQRLREAHAGRGA